MSIRRMGVLLMALGLLVGTQTGAAPLPPVPKTDIVIDIGHGGVDGGTSFGGILEKDINLAVGMKLYPMLRKQGLAAGMTRMSDYALSDDRKAKGSRHKRDLAQRVEIANRLSPALLVSLHVNWTGDRKKSGPLVIYRKGHEPSKRLAAKLQAALNPLYGVKTLPEPGKKYYLLRNTRVPAVIVEMGYMSNGRDRSLLTDPGFQKKLAEAMVQALKEALQEEGMVRQPTGSKRKF